MSKNQPGFQQLFAIVNRGNAEQLFSFLRKFHRHPFQSLPEVLTYKGVIDDQIDFINETNTKYKVTPLIIAAGKGSYEKTKILLVHGANPNKQCATGDTALNLAVHRQKCDIVELLLQYHANPNVYNQAGKTALHRAVASYTGDNVKHVRALLLAGADTSLDDRNQRTPLDEAVFSDKSEILGVLLAHDRSLVQRAYRAAIICARLGHDKCLEILLNYGMDPNITDETNTTALHVAVRSKKLTTVRLLINNGANQKQTNNRGETAISIAQYLPADQQENFMNILHAKSHENIEIKRSLSMPMTNSTRDIISKSDTTSTGASDFYQYTSENAVPYVYPLLRSQPNWTLDNDKYRSSTADDSSVENLLDTSNGTYWCCTQTGNAWVIFDLKHDYNICGMRLIGCDNKSTPKVGHVDVSNAFNGPWLTVANFTCLLTHGNKNDFFFPSLQTRFIRVWIVTNYGGNDLRIQGIGFYGIDMRLMNSLREFGLDQSLNTLLANGINDQDALDEHRDEILNSSDKYLHLNDHFRFLNLTKSLQPSQLTFLDWFDPPQTTAIAGNIFQTFSVIGDKDVTDRVKLEEQLETSPQARTVLFRDLEPIQDYSLVDFSDYKIQYPGRYKVRVVSVESPDIQTPWQEIVVGSTLSYSSKITDAANAHLYLSSTTRLSNKTTTDKENTFLFERRPTTTTTANRTFIAEVYESESDDETYLLPLKTIEQSPSYLSSKRMTRTGDTSQLRADRRPDNTTQTTTVDCYDHTTITDDDGDYFSDSSYGSPSKVKQNKILTPSQNRPGYRGPLKSASPPENQDKQGRVNSDRHLSNQSEQHVEQESIIIPTKYKNIQQRMDELKRMSNGDHGQNKLPNRFDDDNRSNSRRPSETQSWHNRAPSQSQQRYETEQNSSKIAQTSTQYREQEIPSRDKSYPPTSVDRYADPNEGYPSTDKTALSHTKPNNSYEIVDTRYELKKKSSDNRLPDHEANSTEMELVFRATLRGIDVRERAITSIDDYRNEAQHSSSTNGQSPNTNTSGPSTRPALNNDSPMLRPASDNDAPMLRPAPTDDLSGSTGFHGGSSVHDDDSQATAKDSRLYYFGAPKQSQLSDGDYGEADCAVFGRPAQPKPLSNPNTEPQHDYATPATSNYNNNRLRNAQVAQSRDIDATTGYQFNTRDVDAEHYHQAPSSGGQIYSVPRGQEMPNTRQQPPAYAPSSATGRTAYTRQTGSHLPPSEHDEFDTTHISSPVNSYNDQTQNLTTINSSSGRASSINRNTSKQLYTTDDSTDDRFAGSTENSYRAGQHTDDNYYHNSDELEEQPSTRVNYTHDDQDNDYDEDGNLQRSDYQNDEDDDTPSPQGGAMNALVRQNPTLVQPVHRASARRLNISEEPTESRSPSGKPKKDKDSSKPKKERDSSKPKKERDSSKPKKERDSSKPKKERDSSKPKKEQDPSKPKKERDSSKPKKEQDPSKPKKERDSSKPKKEQDPSKPKKERDSSKPKEEQDPSKPKKERDRSKPKKDKDLSKPKKDKDPSKPKKDKDPSKPKKDKPAR